MMIWHRGGHAGLQLALGILGVDDRRVGDDVLDGRGRIADLLDDAVEGLALEGVDREADLLAFLDLADVGLVDGAGRPASWSGRWRP